jgi:arginine/lysine/ornithine decarboxylase
LPPELTKLDGEEVFALDVTELLGLDDLHRPAGIIAQAQELAARAYGAAQSFFLVNGATAGIQALLLAVGAGGKKVLVARNCHHSVLGGLILAGAEPEYLAPLVLQRFGFCAGVETARVAQAFAAHPDAVALLDVRPNYYGVADDLSAQAKLAAAAGKLLLVDEAHGAHLRFHPSLPADAMACGADAAVQGVHKMGFSLTQAAMLHLGKNFPDRQGVADALSMIQTTSPSYLLMASLDLARRQMVLRGEEGLEYTLRLANVVRRQLALVEGLATLTEEDLPQGWTMDGTKLTIAVHGLGLTGFEALELLAQRYRIHLEMADFNNVVAFLSPATTVEECENLIRAFHDVSRRDRRPPVEARSFSGVCMPTPLRRLSPRAAWLAPWEKAPIGEALGRICAETAAVYPPGIPVICPGEEITPEILEYLAMAGKLNLPCHGSADPRLKTIRVVVE